eukprot:5010580-Karenia_brevis.AAC.1
MPEGSSLLRKRRRAESERSQCYWAPAAHAPRRRQLPSGTSPGRKWLRVDSERNIFHQHTPRGVPVRASCVRA